MQQGGGSAFTPGAAGGKSGGKRHKREGETLRWDDSNEDIGVCVACRSALLFVCCGVGTIIRRAECRQQVPLRKESNDSATRFEIVTARERTNWRQRSNANRTIVEIHSNAVHSVIHSHHGALGDALDVEACATISSKERARCAQMETWMHLLKLGFDLSMRFALEIGVGGICCGSIHELSRLQPVEASHRTCALVTDKWASRRELVARWTCEH